MYVEPVMLKDARYFAVYPDGRRCAVTLEDVLQYGAVWEAKDGVRIETEIRHYASKAVGEINYT